MLLLLLLLVFVKPLAFGGFARPPKGLPKRVLIGACVSFIYYIEWHVYLPKVCFVLDIIYII